MGDHLEIAFSPLQDVQGVAYRCQRIAQFVGQHGQELVFPPVRQRELLHLLPEPRFEDVSLGDVVESRQQGRFPLPLGGDDPHLGDARLTIGEGEVDLGRLAGHDRPAEVALDQAIQRPAQQPYRGGVGVANGAVGRNHQDSIGVPLDHALEPRLAGQ